VRDFAVSLVRAFGELLKTLVQDLLGSIFPELAAALVELIDAAVEAAVAAINWIADRLKAGILALLDAIGAAITALLEAYRAAINAALAIARAALTGDWAALARMVLEAALNLAGIPPESFYEVANNAMAALDTILADPGAFVGNVIDAVSLGFSNFADRFLEHLQEGFVAWIVGPLGELGLTLPESWDLMGIFSLVLQVLGLTREGIRLVITEELGETAGTIFDFVWRYVGALITGGLEGLWNEIQNDLGMLWDMVVDGIKSWLLETVVRQAVIRIATMFNPVGALINALITVWNVYQWLRDNAQRIFGIVRAIVDMIGSIAAGNLEPAATAVENALASLIPIAISLLANILGLGGITERVREVLEGVREAVRNAIRSLIRRVRGMFGGGRDRERSSPRAETPSLESTSPRAEAASRTPYRSNGTAQTPC
jgi:phage-related protein